MTKKTRDLIDLIVLVLVVFMLALLSGCATRAERAPDGSWISIKGGGSAKWADGTEIQGGTYIPKLPRIEVEQ